MKTIIIIGIIIVGVIGAIAIFASMPSDTWKDNRTGFTGVSLPDENKDKIDCLSRGGLWDNSCSIERRNLDENFSSYEKYLDENNELNFSLMYDKHGIIIDDLLRIFDYCNYHGEKGSKYFDWNNSTHHIDSQSCEWELISGEKENE